jgi:glycosyltransferase involved in cell wall biosynthesis
MRVSVVILTHNSESTLDRCLKSVRFADEILVVDDFSTDGTFALAKERGVEIKEHKLDNDFAAQREWGAAHAKHEWVLFVDSDEEISAELGAEIESLDERDLDDVGGFRLRRRDFWMGHELKYGETATVRADGIARLIHKGRGEWTRPVHEVWLPFAHYELRRLRNFIDHRPHQDIAEFLREVNRYSSLRARELYEAKTAASIRDVYLIPAGKFLYTYLLKLGFLDGPAGFIYCFMMAFHSFLVRSKLYQYQFESR